MDTCLVHPPVFVFPNDTGERWIDFLVLDAMFNALSLKQGQELPPHEITLHSLPLAAPTLIFLELQVLEHNSFVLFLCVVDDLLHQASNIIISLIRAAVENSCIDEGFGFN